MKALLPHILLLTCLIFGTQAAAQSEFRPDSLVFDADNYEPDHKVTENEFVYEYSAFIAEVGQSEPREVVRFKIVDDGWLIDYGDYVRNYFPFWPVMSFEVADANGVFHQSALHYSHAIKPGMRLFIKLRSVNRNSIPDVMWEKRFTFDESGFMKLYEILYFQEDGIHYGERTMREPDGQTLKTTSYKLIGKDWYRTQIDVTTKNKQGKITHQEIHKVDMLTDAMVKASVMDAKYDRQGRTVRIVTYSSTAAGTVRGGRRNQYEDFGNNSLTEDKMWSRNEIKYGLFGKRTTIEYLWSNGVWVKHSKKVEKLLKNGEPDPDFATQKYIFEDGKWVAWHVLSVTE